MASLKVRNGKFYAQYYVGTKQKRVSLETDSRQVAKEKLRQLESALVRGEANPLPTKTPIGQVLDAYIKHIRAGLRPNGFRLTLQTSTRPSRWWNHSKYSDLANFIAHDVDHLHQELGGSLRGQRRNLHLLRSFLNTPGCTYGLFPLLT